MSDLRWWAWRGPAHQRRGRSRGPALCGAALDRRACYALPGKPRCQACECLLREQQASIAAHLCAGIPPAVEADTVVDAGEPEPVGVARHRTIGGRGAVARLREENDRG